MVIKKLYKFYKKHEGEILWASIAAFVIYTFEVKNHLNIVEMKLNYLQEKAELAKNECKESESEYKELKKTYNDFNQRLDKIEDRNKVLQPVRK